MKTLAFILLAGIAHPAMGYDQCAGLAKLVHSIAEARDAGMPPKDLYAAADQADEPKQVPIARAAVKLVLASPHQTPERISAALYLECKKEESRWTR